MAGAGIRYEPLTFRGYDSMTSLYLWSEWTLQIDDGLSADALRSLQEALFRMIAHELQWQHVVAAWAVAPKKKELRALAVWKLPPGDPGTAYLNGINTISTWDEYAALSQYILSWDANLYRSSGFGPDRVEDAPGVLLANGSPASIDAVLPFKEDLILVTLQNGEQAGENGAAKADIRMQYLTVAAYKQRKVTGKFPYVETLAKNGVIQADVKAADDLDDKPFKFINLSGLQERTPWL